MLEVEELHYVRSATPIDHTHVLLQLHMLETQPQGDNYLQGTFFCNYSLRYTLHALL